jgi:hypothetical protein
MKPTLHQLHNPISPLHNTFVHRGDLVNEINRLGSLYDIKDEAIDTAQIFMLCCTNLHEKCEAKILGIHSQKDKLFRIKRIDSIHSCCKNIKKDMAISFEIQKYPEVKRLGELVEKINKKFKANYYEIFKLQNKNLLLLDSSRDLNSSKDMQENSILEYFDKENLKNSGNLFINELNYSENLDNLSYQKNEDFRLACNLLLKKELLDINNLTENQIENTSEIINVSCNRSNFYFKHVQMCKILRNITELKIYQRSAGTLILGLLFDPCDDHVINSFLVSDDSKIKALEMFLEYDRPIIHSSNNENSSDQFYLIDFDYEIIQFFISKNINFFIKSRAVSLYLQDSKDEDIHSLDYFNILNYGSTQLLDLEIQNI